ncbi:natural cytotoxicity triggering receptor 3-like isoform X3 [Pristis pectinata]|uniref:natural cytotoxicity triggering receptor 3-like isoform X3 n=1 Tax=Pristis pectinata TaxID=685728 RepID=UPI00223E0D23|nr:natural cytotoxicity triggering receptor 3-like isoform X3 [Pristis pectinata]
MAGDSERSRDFEKGRHRTMMWNGFVCSLMLFSGAARKINQSPQRITVTEGGTVQLNCTFSLKSSHQGDKIIGSISWYKDEEDRCVCATCSGYQGRVLLNSSIGILRETLQITDLRINDTGKYYCKVDIFMEAQYLGNGTEVIIRRSGDDGKTLFLNESSIYLPVLSLVVVVPLALALFVIIYTRRRGRLSDKTSGTQVVTKEEGSVIYANPIICNSNRNHPLDYAECESVKSQVRNDGPVKARPLSQAGRSEDSVVYSSVMRSDHMKDPAPLKPKKTPRREENQVVYATVNTRHF